MYYLIGLSPVLALVNTRFSGRIVSGASVSAKWSATKCWLRKPGRRVQDAGTRPAIHHVFPSACQIICILYKVLEIWKGGRMTNLGKYPESKFTVYHGGGTFAVHCYLIIITS